MDKRVVNAVLVIILLAGVAAAGIGIGWGFGTTVNTAPSGMTVTETSTVPTNSTSDSTYKLTRVEIMDVAWNSTAMQPKFYVLGSHGLESSANISLPAHRLIQLAIFSYDTPTSNVSSQYARVEGTVGSTMSFYNGTLNGH